MPDIVRGDARRGGDMARKPTAKGVDLTEAIDVFAIELLAKAKTSDGLADKIAAFAQIARWVGIRYRLEDKGEQTGATLESLRARMRGERSGRPHLTSEFGRNAALRRWGKPGASSTGENGGAELEALRAKVPGFKGPNGKPLTDD
jgi:hypothetical protein